MILGACGERWEEQMRLYFLCLKRIAAGKEKQVFDHRCFEKHWSMLSGSLLRQNCLFSTGTCHTCSCLQGSLLKQVLACFAGSEITWTWCGRIIRSYTLVFRNKGGHHRLVGWSVGLLVGWFKARKWHERIWVLRWASATGYRRISWEELRLSGQELTVA